ncbi:hypothetical protein [Streptomyces sp. CB03238]|uniref:hypothetical protein n=1 Tax=Streptomyces sp. CB03238 TaxID=1907777 RepID=UPI0019D4276E|nr:hypothetical protein [Streptomyces sp. CB03238]
MASRSAPQPFQYTAWGGFRYAEGGQFAGQGVRPEDGLLDLPGGLLGLGGPSGVQTVHDRLDGIEQEFPGAEVIGTERYEPAGFQQVVLQGVRDAAAEAPV